MIAAFDRYLASLREQCPGNRSAMLGLLALVLYAGFWLLNIHVSRVGESLLVLTFLIVLFSHKPMGLKRDPIIVLFWLWLLIQIPVYITATHLFPELASDQITVARHYTKIFMVIIIAWCLAGSIEAFLAVMIIAFLGFVGGALLNDEGGWEAVRRLIHGFRVDFGFRNAQHFAVYSSLFLLLGIFFWRRLLGLFSGNWRWAGYFVLLFWLFVSLAGVIGSLTRASWLGLGIAFVFAVIIFLLIKRKQKQWMNNRVSKWSYKKAAFLMVIVVGLATVLFQSGAYQVIKGRLDAEHKTLSLLFSGKIEEIPYSSIGIRIHTWDKALGWIAERPLLGWGPKSRKGLYSQSDLPKNIISEFGHFHNSYIEITLAYGFIGLLIFAALAGTIGYRTWWAWRKGLMPDDAFLFFSSFFVYWAVVNLFESYVIYSSGYYVNALVGGAAYSFYLKAKLKSVQSNGG